MADSLPVNQVDIWRIDLDMPIDLGAQYQVLSPDEAARADRFHFEEHRRRFIIARAAMRQILGGYFNISAQEIVFRYGDKGKPVLSGSLEHSPIQFNLSHSENVALLSVADGVLLGIDVEQINPRFATIEIAERFFSSGEVRCLRGIPAAEQAEAFFSCWTRKEAYIKAIGDGLSMPLDSFEVAFGPGNPPKVLHSRLDPGVASRWSMYEVDVKSGFVAALVVQGKGQYLAYRRREI